MLISGDRTVQAASLNLQFTGNPLAVNRVLRMIIPITIPQTMLGLGLSRSLGSAFRAAVYKEGY